MENHFHRQVVVQVFEVGGEVRVVGKFGQQAAGAGLGPGLYLHRVFHKHRLQHDARSRLRAVKVVLLHKFPGLAGLNGIVHEGLQRPRRRLKHIAVPIQVLHPVLQPGQGHLAVIGQRVFHRHGPGLFAVEAHGGQRRHFVSGPVRQLDGRLKGHPLRVQRPGKGGTDDSRAPGDERQDGQHRRNAQYSVHAYVSQLI